MNDPVTRFYNQDPELEWKRLVATPYRTIEYEVVLHFLSRYLPPEGRIVDIGGGPGRYTVALARRGYRMTLVDAAARNIEWAKQKCASAGVIDRIDGFFVQDARHLALFDDASFDAVLCMGPLYHLQRNEDRQRCLAECHRIQKANSPIFLTALPRMSYIRDALRAGTFLDSVRDHAAAIEEIQWQGYSMHAQLPNIYFCDPAEIPAQLRRAGYDCLEIASTHGFVSFFDDQVNLAAADAQVWNRLLQWIIDSCTDPAALSAADHLFAVGRKRANQEK